ncbi:sensor histidine kinase [Streptosporangium sp. KLBMP 9127]|nr:HAMP domain-containing histidine kinase [Streptosporangium sp. KLBMP 9127]
MRRRLRLVKPGLRLRLTLLYSGLFFAAGTTLLITTYLLTARAMNEQLVTRLPDKIISRLAPPVPKEGMAVRVNDTFVRQIEVGKAGVLEEVLRNSVVIMVVVGVLAILFGWLMTDRALRPLHQVTSAAERLSESTLHERIALAGPRDDVKRLADTFDAMLDRLQRSFDAQRRFVSNASHELRTPIAINRTLIEVALEEPDVSDDLRSLAKSLLGTNARHERLIEGLLLLARSEHEIVACKPIDLDHLIHSVLEQLESVTQRRKLTVQADLTPSEVGGEPALIERCVFNLLENAAKYNVRDGRIWVALARDADETTLTVENTGPVIPAHEVDDLFEPFRRLQDRVGSATGAGLGLSIVRAIVTAHGGVVSAAPRPSGGLSVTIRLPMPPESGRGG